VTIEIIVFLGLVFTLTALIAKAYERRQDVLYGPHIQGRIGNVLSKPRLLTWRKRSKPAACSDISRTSAGNFAT
jgi:hypothetical protein